MLPDYWLERPPLDIDAVKQAVIEEFLSGGDMESALRERDVTPWVFLAGLAERRRIAFHGTGDAGIERFEPRRPIDLAPFGDQEAVFATSDPIWAMFYAIVDRDRYPITLANACISLLEDDGRPGIPHYVFSISADALRQRPWRTGHVYLLPADTFAEQAPGPYAGREARVPQLASPVPVAPLARLEIRPEDFPFLALIRGHEDERLGEYAEALMTAGPWPA